MSDIVIVSCGPGVHGKSLGDRIDSFEIVIRIRDMIWQNVEDYGSKMDYLVTSPCRQIVDAFNDINVGKIPDKELWLIANPDKEVDDKNLPRIDLIESTGVKYRVLRHHYRFCWGYIKTPDHRPRLSLGFRTIINAMIELKPDRIFLAGFDNLLSGRDDVYISKQKVISPIRHQREICYDSEKQGLERIAKELEFEYMDLTA